MTGRQLYTAIIVGGLLTLALQIVFAFAAAGLKERRSRR